MSWFPLPRLAFLSLLFTLLPFHLQSISTDTDYIHRSCYNSTDYPKLCFKTLSRYARVVQSNPARLVLVAISVSHSHANGVAASLSNIINSSREVRIKECADFLIDATEEIGDSLGQMREMREDPEAPDFRSNVSNVETWMSAAVAYEDSCIDELKDVTDAEMKKHLFYRVHHVLKITLNALALVDDYFNSLAPTPWPWP